MILQHQTQNHKLGAELFISMAVIDTGDKVLRSEWIVNHPRANAI